MTCPACSQTASTWMRNSFSLQGVTLSQSLKGELKCQHCGALLRNAKYNKHLWYSLAAMFVFITLIALFSDRLYFNYGFTGVALYWVVIVAGSTMIFVYGMWKYAVLEVVKDEASTKQTDTGEK